MNIKKYIITSLLVFGITIPVNAYELCTPTKEYNDYQKLSSEEKSKYKEPIFCSEIVNSKKQSTFLKSNLYSKLYSSASDSSYNSYTSGVATSPKNQDATGLCWDFASISTVEANANKKGLGTLDLSEAHLAYSILARTYSDSTSQRNKKYDVDTNGGKITYAPSYFYGRYGQLTENELPFMSNLVLDSNYTDGTKTLSKITPSTYISGRNILTLDNYNLDVIRNTGTCTSSEISTIKTSIIKNGAVYATMFMDQELFNDSSEEYYIAKTTDSEYTNHAITIVGWDDNISKSHFNGATRNGAWIIKNSWGTDWSNDGFFYISYDDAFICSSIASYELSSQPKSYNYTYKSSPVVGIPLLSLENTIYLATKFTKQSTNSEVKEALERVSISVGEYMNYTVYLSKDNDKNNQSNWIELASGNSSLYGIRSIDLTNQEIDGDFTIIIKYTISSGKESSLFMTCDYMDETKYIDYTSNTNYMSENGTTWTDMSNIRISGVSLKCQPNTYVYTNELTELEITNTTETTTGVDVDLKLSNIDTNAITYKVEDSNNEDVTSHFTITPDYNNKKVSVVSDNTLIGTFTLKIIYNSIVKTTEFTLSSNISVIDDTKSRIDTNNDNLNVVLPKGENLTYKKLMDNLSNNNTEVVIKNPSDQVVTGDNTTVGTGYTISFNNNTYSIILIGDANGDGYIDSGDLLKLLRHLQHTTTLSEAQLQAANCNNDEYLDSGDLLRLLRFLQGTSQINIR